MASQVLNIAEQQDADWPQVWAILEPTFRAGESYPLPRDVDEGDARKYWIKTDGFNAIARDSNGNLCGVYYIRPDQGGPGDHICNAGYVVSPDQRGRGYAGALCQDSLVRARAMGFAAMKFNLVVADNEPAVKAWRQAGFKIIGTIPEAFRHPSSGIVDAYIMYQKL